MNTAVIKQKRAETQERINKMRLQMFELESEIKMLEDQIHIYNHSLNVLKTQPFNPMNGLEFK